ncbi:MAG: hypothetical protein JXP34_26690 [Planctomycetes bacterium]|nr:hypothetical protein [Planctomycetota bacterium]
MTPHPRGFDPDEGIFRDVDDLLEAGAPPPASADVVDRLAASVLRRLRWRRIRVRAAWGIAASAAATLLLAWILRTPSGTGPSLEPPPEGVVSVEPSPVAPSAAQILEEAISAISIRDRATQGALQRLRGAGAEALALLVREIRSQDGDRAETAARLLASLGTAAGDEAAVDLALRPPSERILRAILGGLLSRSDLSAERRIRSLLASDPAGAEIVALLDPSDRARAIPLLFDAARSDSPGVRILAVRALASRTPSRAAALFAWTAKAWGSGSGEDLGAFVSGTLPGQDPRAIRAIAGEIRRAIRASPSGLRNAAESAPTWIDRLGASLGASAVEEAWPPLAAILEEVGPRPAAIRACGDLGDIRAVPLLERYLLAFNRTSAEAARALGRLRGPQALGVLLAGHRMIRLPADGLPSEIEAARDAIAGALRGRRDETIDLLCANLRGGQPVGDDIAALVDLFPDDAAHAIGRVLFTAGRDVRPLLLRGLADVGSREAIAILVRALEDPGLASMARAHLIRLTARDFGPRPDAWRRWLSRPGEEACEGFRGGGRGLIARDLTCHDPSGREAS